MVKKKLAAVGEESLHVWIRGIHDQVFRQIAAYDILIEIKSLPVPFRIFEHYVAILIVDIRRRYGALSLDAPAQLRPRHERVEKRFSCARIDWGRINLFCGLYLRCGQALGSI